MAVATCAGGRLWPVSCKDAGPLVTAVVRCDLVIRGPDVAPVWPQHHLPEAQPLGHCHETCAMVPLESAGGGSSAGACVNPPEKSPLVAPASEEENG